MTDYQDNSSFDGLASSSSLTEGRSFGKGRGFILSKVDDDDWSTVGAQSAVPHTSADDFTSNRNDDQFEDCNQEYSNRDYSSEKDESRQSRRGRGGRGGRGGRVSGRDEYENRNDRYDRQDNSRNDDNWNSENQNNDDKRNRGPRHNDRNKDDENITNDNDGENTEEKKPPVTYIPPEENEDLFYGAGVTAGINFDKYDNIKVKVTGENIPPPIETFGDIKLRTALLDNINKSCYQKPTPVQKYAIPIILQKRDIMACAQTGSGKTAAYLIPIIHHLLEDLREVQITERGCEPQVVMMAPTRELVIQICNEGKKFAKGTIIKCISCYGGVKPGYQAEQLRRGAHIVVATPGRLNDFVQSGRIRFNSVRFIVLDEADRMLDQGFLGAMEQILDHETMVPTGERQTLMFSATFGKDIQELAIKFLLDYVFLAVGIVGGACTDVTQNFYEVKKDEKRAKLKELLEEDEHTLKNKTLVFVETQKTADFIAAYMSEQKYPSTSIHGAREQEQRESALKDFRSGKMPILIATSVAARGLDIQNVTHVINYDLPKSIEDYVHRIGRTGRVGNQGRATSFYNPEFDSRLMPDLIKILEQANQPIPSFFEGGDGGNYNGGRADNFGGYDIRDDYASVNTEPQESW